MTNKPTPNPDLIHRIDEAIRYRIRETDEFDNLGNPIAAMAESDKYALAKKTGAELADVEQRLKAICEELAGEHSSIVPCYRLRGPSVQNDRDEQNRSTDCQLRCVSVHPQHDEQAPGR